jgi:hypothetical protein
MCERSADVLATVRRDNRRMMSDAAAPRPVHNAAQWRKRLQRELRRVGANKVSLYVDGPRGTVRVRFPDHAGQFVVPAEDALEHLRSLTDDAGLEQTIDTLLSSSSGQFESDRSSETASPSTAPRS